MKRVLIGFGTVVHKPLLERPSPNGAPSVAGAKGIAATSRKEVLTEEIKLWDKAAEATAQVLAAEVIASQEIFQVQSFSATKEPT